LSGLKSPVERGDEIAFTGWVRREERKMEVGREKDGSGREGGERDRGEEKGLKDETGIEIDLL